MRFRIEAGLAAGERAAFGRSDEAGAAPVLGMRPDGAFAARSPEGALLGTVTCVVWEQLAWIGNMIVAPEAREHGIESALLRAALEFTDARAEVVALDSTQEARPLYERAGFRAVGESALWERKAEPRDREGRARGDDAIYPVSTAEMMELLACDAPRFGAPRGRFLAALVAAHPHRAFVSVDRKSGAFSGLALGMGDRVGPLVADTADAAARLLRAAESAGTPARAIVASWNPHARAMFEAAGYAPAEAPCARMVRGAPGLPGRTDTQYAVGSWALG